MTRERNRWFLAVAIGCFLIVGILLLPSTGRDDSHITYWAAHSLANFGEIVNYSGDRVEQSSSLLLVVTLAVLSWIIPLPLTELGWLSSVLFGVGTLLVSARLARALELQAGQYVALIVGTSPYFVYWSFSGMETSLASAVYTYFVLSCVRYFLAQDASGKSHIAHLAASSAMYLLCRPESGIVAAAWLAALFAVSLFRQRIRGDSDANTGPSLAKLAAATAVVVALICGITVFRLAYFGSIVPNAVNAKIGRDFLGALGSGLGYLFDHSLHPAVAVPSLATFLAVALVLAKNIGRFTSRAFVLVSLCVYVASHLSFVVLSGGDWMEGGRFLVPIAPVCGVLLAAASEQFREALRGRVLTVLVAVQVVGILVVFATFSSARPIWTYPKTVADYPIAREYGFSEAMNNIHLRDVPLSDAMADIVAIVMQEKGERVTILSEYGGMVIYHVARKYFPNVKFVDRFGVSSRDVFGCRRYSAFRKTSEGVMTPFGDLVGQGASCGSLEIDIVFSHGSQARRLQSHGYGPIYYQSGTVNAYSSAPRRRISGEMVIAVNNRYEEALRSRLERTSFTWKRAVKQEDRAAGERKEMAGNGVRESELGPSAHAALVSVLASEPRGTPVWFAVSELDAGSKVLLQRLRGAFVKAGWNVEGTLVVPFSIRPGVMVLAADGTPPGYVQTARDALRAAGFEPGFGTAYRDYFQEMTRTRPGFRGFEMEPRQTYVIVLGRRN